MCGKAREGFFFQMLPGFIVKSLQISLISMIDIFDVSRTRKVLIEITKVGVVRRRVVNTVLQLVKPR
jgi:hypothetical protein